MSQPDTAGYDVLWPRGERNTKVTAMAPRHSTLAGKKIALLWDYIFKGDVVFDELAKGLKERFPGVEFVHWDVFGNIHGPDERNIIAGLGNKLKEMKIHAALSGMGC